MSQQLLSLRSTRSVPIIELFDQGLSFKLMLSLGVLPPLKTMNTFLSCGRDDTDGEDGLVEWEPFSLTPQGYKQLAARLRKNGHKFVIEKTPSGRPSPSYSQWFEGHLAKRDVGMK